MSAVPASAATTSEASGPSGSAGGRAGHDRRGVRLGDLPGGDGIRAYAVTLVVIYHIYVAWLAISGGSRLTRGLLPHVAERGAVSVYIFFALSGYLVGGPWVRALCGDARRPSVVRYLDHRVRRIVPAFWLVCVLAFVLLGRDSASNAQLIGTPLFVQVFTAPPNYTPMLQGWTVDLEAMFYLLLPLVLLVALARLNGPKRRWWFVAGLIAVSVPSLLLRVGTPAESVAAGARTILVFIWAFAPGMLAAAVEVPARAWLARHPRAARAVPFALLAVAAITYVWLCAADAIDGRLWSLVGYSVLSTALLLAALSYGWTRDRALAILTPRPVAAIGRWSYGIYLLHLPLGNVIFDHRPGGVGPNGILAYLTVTVCGASVLAAAALWHFVEEPILKRKRR